MRRPLAAAALATLLATHAATASAHPGELPATPEIGLAAELSAGRIAEDTFGSLDLKVGAQLSVPALLCDPSLNTHDCQTLLRAALHAPLRLRVVDQPPEDASLLRRQDWDEPADALRLLRHLEYGLPGDTLRLRVGELGPLTLGHGSLVQDYFSVLTPDLPRVAAHASLDTPGWAASATVTDLTRPSFFFARAQVRPLHWLLPGSFLARLTLGASLVSDLGAPTTLAPGSAASPTSSPAVTDQAATTLLGADIEYALTGSEDLDLRLYSDLGALPGEGLNVHAGLIGSATISGALTARAQLEYAWLSGGLTPRYVGPLYEVDRFQLSGWGLGLPAPRRRVAASIDLDGVQSSRADLSLNVLPIGLLARAAYTRISQASDADSFTAALTLSPPPLPALQLAAFYHHQSFEGLDRAISWRDETLLSAEARLDLAPWLYLSGRLDRQFSLDDSGLFSPITTWSAGLGTSWTLSMP